MISFTDRSRKGIAQSQNEFIFICLRTSILFNICTNPQPSIISTQGSFCSVPFCACYFAHWIREVPVGLEWELSDVVICISQEVSGEYVFFHIDVGYFSAVFVKICILVLCPFQGFMSICGISSITFIIFILLSSELFYASLFLIYGSQIFFPIPCPVFMFCLLFLLLCGIFYI